MSSNLDAEIDRNLFAFLPKIPDLIERYRDEFALLRNQEVVSIHPHLGEALQTAQAQFADGIYSIQQVTDKPIELGFFSYADHQG